MCFHKRIFTLENTKEFSFWKNTGLIFGIQSIYVLTKTILDLNVKNIDIHHVCVMDHIHTL